MDRKKMGLHQRWTAECLRRPLQAGEATSLGPLGQGERNLPVSKGLRHDGAHDSAPCGRKVVGCAKTKAGGWTGRDASCSWNMGRGPTFRELRNASF